MSSENRVMRKFQALSVNIGLSKAQLCKTACAELPAVESNRTTAVQSLWKGRWEVDIAIEVY